MKILKKHFELYYDSCYYNTYEHESNFFKDYWGKAGLVERYLVEKLEAEKETIKDKKNITILYQLCIVIKKFFHIF